MKIIDLFCGIGGFRIALEKAGQDIHGVMYDKRIRRLTPVECERLQSFPDNFTKYGINDKKEKVEISDTQRYKMCGNAITVNVVYEIAKRLGD